VEHQFSSETKLSAGRVTLRVILLLVLPLIALAIGGVIYLHGGRYVETDNAYVKADVIPISAEVSAAITKVLVKENQFVSTGDVLFELRSTPYQLAVDDARATMAEIHTELSALRASYYEKQGNIELARSNFEFAQKELKRQRDLKGKNFVSESTLDDLEHNVETARQQLQVLNLDLQRIVASLGGDANAPLVHEAESEPTQHADADADKIRIPARFDFSTVIAVAGPGKAVWLVHRFGFVH
jgi:membrane fusion protein (multidrug efflux system)